MGNKLGSRGEEIGPDDELGVRRNSRSVSWRGVFRRKPAATFLDYEGTSFDNYLQQASSATLANKRGSLRNSFEGFPLHRNRSASTGDQDKLYPMSSKAKKESQSFLTSSEDICEHIYSNLVPEPSYESLNPKTPETSLNPKTPETFPTMPPATRRLLFSTERQVSHNEEEALELMPEYICVPNDRFDDTEDSEPATFDGEDKQLDEGVEKVKVAASSKSRVTFENGAEGGETSKCSAARCDSAKKRVGRGQEAIYLQPCDHLGDHLGDHLTSPQRRHPANLSIVTSGAHLPKVNNT